MKTSATHDAYKKRCVLFSKFIYLEIIFQKEKKLLETTVHIIFGKKKLRCRGSIYLGPKTEKMRKIILPMSFDVCGLLKYCLSFFLINFKEIKNVKSNTK